MIVGLDGRGMRARRRGGDSRCWNARRWVLVEKALRWEMSLDLYDEDEVDGVVSPRYEH